MFLVLFCVLLCVFVASKLYFNHWDRVSQSPVNIVATKFNQSQSQFLVATTYIPSKLFTRDVLDGLEEGGEGGVDTFRIQEVIMKHKTG